MKKAFSKRDIKQKANEYKTQLEFWKVRYILQGEKIIVCMINSGLKMLKKELENL